MTDLKNIVFYKDFTFGLFEKGGEWILTKEESEAIHKAFNYLYSNRLSYLEEANK